MDEPQPKRRKISLACQTCRERKIRCDGERPACGSCRRGRRNPVLPCAYMPTATGMMAREMSVQSMADRLRKLEKELVAATSKTSSRASQEPARSSSSADEDDDEHDHDHGREDRSESSEMGRYEYASRHLSNASFAGVSPRALDPHRRATSPGRELGAAAEQIWNPLRTHNGLHGEHHAVPQGAFRLPSEGGSPPLLLAPDTPDNRRSSSSVTSRPNTLFSGEHITSPSATTASRPEPENDIQYYGGSSSTSFMREMNKTLSSKVGTPGDHAYPAATAQQGLFGIIVPNGKGYPPPTEALPGPETALFEMENYALPARHVADHLLQCYWTHINPLFPFIHQPTFTKAYDMLWATSTDYAHLRDDTDAGLGNATDAGPQSQVFHCALNLMLALGVYYSDIAEDRRQSVMGIFLKRSGNLLVVDMMDKGTVALVQTLLLTAHFYHGHPQRCWNSLGVAYRIGQGIGLHIGKCTPKMSRLGREMRRRVWHGCIMLDTGSSMVLGRPLVTDFSVPLPAVIDDDDLENDSPIAAPQPFLPRMMFYVQALKLNKVLGSILRALYEPEYFTANDETLKEPAPDNLRTFGDMEAVLKLEREMMTFYRDLPDELRWDRRGGDVEPVPPYIEAQRTALQARYLDIQILLYRTVFTRLCQISQMSLQNSRNPEAPEDQELTMQTFFATKCSMMCVAAAQKLIPLVQHHLRVESVDTWWYNMLYTHTAGLVITMARICHPLHDRLDMASLDESWQMCQQTLISMSTHGDGPRKCLDSIQVMQQQITRWESTFRKTDPRRDMMRHQPEAAAATAVAMHHQHPVARSGDATFGLVNTPGGLLGGEVVDEVMPPIDVENWRDMEAENSLWTVDLGEWWNNPACDFL